MQDYDIGKQNFETSQEKKLQETSKSKYKENGERSFVRTHEVKNILEEYNKPPKMLFVLLIINRSGARFQSALISITKNEAVSLTQSPFLNNVNERYCPFIEGE